ncbi:hypothetical protein OC25_02060 [Pedobacter kyungheensis]|uniref:Uncharacterized protein n=1 Tax=Pedobacter kyungheensis TaxID=1069985 RepID=A0A0C1FUF6_9SPHI|nr:hypothetical protein [Pedobacter kyungheensis]KIA96552.1 hypothetical protein OC25_02060 [Pedobacter kyungheensis]
MVDKLTDELQCENDYYRSQFIGSQRSKEMGDNSMTFIVKEDTDLLQFADAAKAVWESVGDYPTSFTGVVRTEKGNAFATFQYVGALGFAVAVNR